MTILGINILFQRILFYKDIIMDGVYSIQLELMKLDEERYFEYALINIKITEFVPIILIKSILDPIWQITNKKKLMALQESVVSLVEFTITKSMGTCVLNDVNIMHVYVEEQ